MNGDPHISGNFSYLFLLQTACGGEPQLHIRYLRAESELTREISGSVIFLDSRVCHETPVERYRSVSKSMGRAGVIYHFSAD